MLGIAEVNNISIKAVSIKGNIYILAKCQSNRGNLEVVKIPAEYGMYWYPLPFYLDYHYMTNYKSILLKADEKYAPKDIVDKLKHKNYFLHNFYDYKHDKLGDDITMYKLNLGITTKLKSIGLKTWDGFYNLQDVAYNYQVLQNSLEAVEQTIIKREEDKGINPNKISNNPMDYATDDESTYLLDIGLGYRMTGYMRKVANAMYKGAGRV